MSTSTATKSVTAATEFTSFLVTESTKYSPMPCQPKIRSVNVAPTKSSANWYAKNVAIGMSAVRSPCLMSARERRSPLARAVRRKSLPSTSSMALR